MKVIISEDIVRKEKINSGSYSHVWPSIKKDTIIKSPRNDLRDIKNIYSNSEINIFQFMQKHPDIFAIIKKINNKYIVQEKINIDKFRLDLNDLVDDYNKFIYEKNLSDLFFNLKTIITHGINLVEQEIDIVYSLISENNKILLKKLVLLCENLHDAIQNDSYRINTHLDFKPSNMGYDKDGNVKIVDFDAPNNQKI